MGRIGMKALRASAAGLALAAALMVRPAAAACEFATLAEAEALARRAAALLERLGPGPAFAAFMDRDREFIDRDLYVFVLDLDGTMWASGAFPQSIGSNALGARDSRGRYYIRRMIRLAMERGEGWVEYEWFNPCSGEIAPKASFIVRVGPFIVGVGAYGTISAGRRRDAPRPAHG